MRWHAQHNSVHLSRRAAYALSDNDNTPAPDGTLNDGPSKTLEKRVEMTCGADGFSECKYAKTNKSNQNVPIAVGIVSMDTSNSRKLRSVPLVVALTAFVFFYRKYKKRQRLEDIKNNDKHGSLDFGMAEVQGRKKTKKGKKGAPEMAVNDLGDEKKFHRQHGMSLDMGSPYIIPGDIAPSRGSFNSTSRSAHGGDDPYQAINLMKSPSRSTSNPPTSKTFMSQSSDDNPQNSTTNLLRGAQKPSRTSPPNDMASLTTRSSSPTTVPSISVPEPSHSVSRKPVGLRKPGSNDDSLPEAAGSPQPPPAPPKDSTTPASNFSLPKNVDRSSISTQGTANASQERAHSPPPPLPQRSSSKGVAMHSSGGVNSTPFDDYQTYADVLGIAQLDSKTSPPLGQDPNAALSTIHEPGTGAPRGDGLAVPEGQQDTRRYSAGLRPLPAVDPADNAEQRANRIRSFYKEYFEETYQGDDYDNYDYGEYYEDYGQEYLNGATIWDPETGQFVMAGGAPYAEPVTRRAMTPPPRGPPRFRAGPGGHRFTSSSGQSHAGGRARAFSSASGRPAPGGRGRPPKRRLPPPGPLSNLPTPHLLKDDSAAFSAIDFAPPPSMRDQRAGRSASPRMDARPFSPSVRAHTPLTTSFQDLAAMPSPHALRKSGTFTALDFAPPQPRFRGGDNASDAGSIRSGKSGLSAHHAANIHQGAYRLSRLQQDNVGTKDDLLSTLKPKWEMGR
ncbi:MAG: hypothetical protein M1831_004124 [Alyxoria varia]|nr:MAG: hypothetical protein M1831_004124 [Alyxoria varia]